MFYFSISYTYFLMLFCMLYNVNQVIAIRISHFIYAKTMTYDLLRAQQLKNKFLIEYIKFSQIVHLLVVFGW